MTRPNDGGPAFPVTFEDGLAEKFTSGMSLLKYFAGKAMQARLIGLSEGQRGDEFRGWCSEKGLDVYARIAFESYNLAEAMVAEGERRAAGTEKEIKAPDSKFKLDDRVRVVEDTRPGTKGCVGEVVYTHKPSDGPRKYNVWLDEKGLYTDFTEDDLEAVEEGKDD